MKWLNKNLHTTISTKLLIVFILLIVALSYFYTNFYKNENILNEINIGYFHGGRVNMMYRAHIYNFFDNEGIKVKLYTQDLRGTELIELPKSNSEFNTIREQYSHLGKMRGIAIVEKMVNGKLHAGTIGESSFIQKITEGAPIVAVALLGADKVPGKGVVLQKGIVINSPENYKGLTLASRRAGPGDTIFFMEFLEDEGLSKEDLNIIGEVDEFTVNELVINGKVKDKVNIITQIDEDYMADWFESGIIDGGLYHLTSIRELIAGRDVGYLFRGMDWMNPAISHSVLVFNKAYVESHQEEVQKVVNALVKRIQFERNLPDEKVDRGWDKGLFMDSTFQGLSSPKYDFPPLVRRDLLYEVQNLLLKYEYIDKKIDIEKFIDDSFVEKAYEEIK